MLVLLIANLIACSHAPVALEEPAPPARPVDPETWRLVNRQIVAASAQARRAAEAYARVAMDEWQGLVRQQTEDVFIPWYLSYWTQQWIGARMAWYGLHESGGQSAAREQLVAYLQEQFQEQVLGPVSGFVDPRRVMEETLADYIRSLEAGIEWLPLEYGIPLAAFNDHLDAIPAIVVRTPQQQVSLYQVLHSPDSSDLPGYAALLGDADIVGDPTGQAPSSDRLQSVAGRAVAGLADSMALRGGALVASGLLGGPLGMAISAGATAWGVVEHDRERPALEAQLRADLEAALDAAWQQLLEEADAGVMAPMHRLSAQVERAAAGEAPGEGAPAVSGPGLLF